jgi:hypothetical protein
VRPQYFSQAELALRICAGEHIILWLEVLSGYGTFPFWRIRHSPSMRLCQTFSAEFIVFFSCFKKSRNSGMHVSGTDLD